MTERWTPRPRLHDGPDGRGESGARDDLVIRRETEEAAVTGRFVEGGEIRDDSNPIEPRDEAEGDLDGSDANRR